MHAVTYQGMSPIEYARITALAEQVGFTLPEWQTELLLHGNAYVSIPRHNGRATLLRTIEAHRHFLGPLAGPWTCKRGQWARH